PPEFAIGHLSLVICHFREDFDLPRPWPEEREDSHLCRRANRWIFWPDIQETDCITKTLSTASRPGFKLPPRPLEAMVFVPESLGGQVFELHVIFHVRCRQNHRSEERRVGKECK